MNTARWAKAKHASSILQAIGLTAELADWCLERLDPRTNFEAVDTYSLVREALAVGFGIMLRNQSDVTAELPAVRAEMQKLTRALKAAEGRANELEADQKRAAEARDALEKVWTALQLLGKPTPGKVALPLRQAVEVAQDIPT